MKTTLNIADDLFHRARELAQREGTTLRALIEEALQAALSHREEKPSYRWADLSVDGEGLSPELEEGGWDAVRDRIYSERWA